MQLNIEQNTDEWLALRRSGVGSSDVAAILGLSPFKTATDVYYEKCGFSDNFTNKAMAHGKLHEPDALVLVNEKMKSAYSPTVFSTGHFIASLDGYWAEDDSLLELKSPISQKVKEDARRDFIPKYYWVQVQWQLMVSGAKRAYYAVYDADAKELLCYMSIMPDRTFFKEMELAANSFWENYLKGIPPEVEERHMVIEDPRLEKLVEQYRAFHEQKSPLEKAAAVLDKEMKAIRTEIFDFADDGNFRGHGIKVTFCYQKQAYDMEKMEKEGIDISKYKKPSTGYFRITLEKDLL